MKTLIFTWFTEGVLVLARRLYSELLRRIIAESLAHPPNILASIILYLGICP